MSGDRHSTSREGTQPVSGATVCRLMRRHRVTIRQIAARYNIPMTRVRYVRAHGGPLDWPLMIVTCAQEARS